MGGVQLDRRLALKTGLVALGVVWGWWSAPVSTKGRGALLLLGVASVQGAEAVWVAGSPSLPLLFGGWLIGLLLHRAFRSALTS